MILFVFFIVLVVGFFLFVVVFVVFLVMIDYIIFLVVIKMLMEFDKECVMFWGFNIINFMIFIFVFGNNYF